LISGIKDVSSVNPDLTLGDLGLDSLMGVEIKQTLERDYDISMAAKEIRALTFAKLDQLSTCSSSPSAADNAASSGSETVVATPAAGAAASVRYSLDHLCPTDAVVEMNAAAVETEAPPLFVVHAIEGSVFLLRSAMSKVRSAKVYGFQCTDDTPQTSIPELASHYIEVYNAKFICQNTHTHTQQQYGVYTKHRKNGKCE